MKGPPVPESRFSISPDLLVPNPGHARVLLVHPEASARARFRHELEAASFDVDEADTAALIPAQMTPLGFDAVVVYTTSATRAATLDAIRQVRGGEREHGQSGTPIVIAMPAADPLWRGRALHTGADDVLALNGPRSVISALDRLIAVAEPNS
jgi:DNA-binding response OmpR family regulator